VEIVEPETEKSPRSPRPGAGMIRFLAIGYLITLVAVVAGLRLGGERWWLATVALYLPRIGFGFPLPFVVAGLLGTRSYRLLPTQIACAVIVLFPLMGLRLGGPQAPTPGAWRFRVFTANVGKGAGGIAQIVARARSANPDLIVLEEVADAPFGIERLRAGFAGYVLWSSGQFAVASRFPIEDAELPPPLPLGDRLVSRNYARLRLLTPAGPIRLYAVHPISPHGAFDELRDDRPGTGFTDQILTARVLDPQASAIVQENTARRVSQVRALADDARQSPEPVLIAGDTNLPGLSWALATLLGDYHDAFAEAGRGFGYTYPAWHRRWLRIDRILGGPRLHFLSAVSEPPRLYAHLPLTADVELLPAAR
jgi:vancomycin resistance protein VanJ